MRPAGRHQQVFDRSAVIAQNVPVADAEPSAVDDDDAPRFERFRWLVDRLPAAHDTEIGPLGCELTDQTIDASLEIAAANRWSHRGRKDGRRQNLVLGANARTHDAGELDEVAARRCRTVA